WKRQAGRGEQSVAHGDAARGTERKRGDGHHDRRPRRVRSLSVSAIVGARPAARVPARGGRGRQQALVVVARWDEIQRRLGLPGVADDHVISLRKLLWVVRRRRVEIRLVPTVVERILRLTPDDVAELRLAPAVRHRRGVARVVPGRLAPGYRLAVGRRRVI